MKTLPELIKSFAKTFQRYSELFKLLQNTLKLEERKDKKKTEEKKSQKEKVDEKPFKPKRFPFAIQAEQKKDGVNVVSLPLNGEKTIKFDTDVANDYFDRVEESGELQLALLQIKHNERKGGDQPEKKRKSLASLTL